MAIEGLGKVGQISNTGSKLFLSHIFGNNQRAQQFEVDQLSNLASFIQLMQRQQDERNQIRRKFRQQTIEGIMRAGSSIASGFAGVGG